MRGEGQNNMEYNNHFSSIFNFNLVKVFTLFLIDLDSYVQKSFLNL